MNYKHRPDYAPRIEGRVYAIGLVVLALVALCFAAYVVLGLGKDIDAKLRTVGRIARLWAKGQGIGEGKAGLPGADEGDAEPDPCVSPSQRRYLREQAAKQKN